MMRLLRVTVTLIFIAVSVLFAYVFYNEYVTTDNTYPVIKIDDSLLVISVKDGNDKLLEGVSAYDEKDGDLSDKVIVESVSKFTEKGICNVTYAVCDSDKHVATAVRRIKYSDYSSPKFYMNEALCYSVSKYINIDGVVGAKDDIDGDISKSVIMTSEHFETGITGTFTVNAKVSNSKGETITLELPLIVEERSLSAPTIELESYLIYVKKGADIDFSDYVACVKDASGIQTDLEVTVQTEFNPKKAGVYSVHYYAVDAMERKGHTVLMVVVE